MVIFQSVVSGEVESDLITVHRNWNNELTVLDRKIGYKKSKLELAGKYSEPVFKTTWEIGTIWELRTATSVSMPIQYR